MLINIAYMSAFCTTLMWRVVSVSRVRLSMMTHGDTAIQFSFFFMPRPRDRERDLERDLDTR